MEDSAVQVGAFVDDVLAATGAALLDILGISQGTLVPNYSVAPRRSTSTCPWARAGTARWADPAATGGGPLDLVPDDMHGVVPPCIVCFQGLPGSEFMAKMLEGGVYAPDVTYTNIMTRYDELILPYTSGYVEAPNATNIVVQDACPQDFSDHLALAASRVAAGHVLNALDPAHPRPVPCVPVRPFVGG